VAALCYTPGWLLPITRHLPGFDFFQGPGRFGIVTTLAVALLAGMALEQFVTRPTMPIRHGVIVAVAVFVTALSVLSLAGDVTFAVKELGAANPLVFGRGPVGERLITGCMTTWIAAAFIGLFLACRQRPVVQRSRFITGKVLLCCAVFAVSIADLWMVSRLVTTSYLINDPPINHLAESPVRQELAVSAGWRPTVTDKAQPPRLFAPMANFTNVLGCSSLPVYLTFGPAQYDTILDPTLDEIQPGFSDKWRERLSAYGVTYLLRLEPLPDGDDLRKRRVELVWQGDDPVLNRALGRSGQPLFLYELRSEPRAANASHGARAILVPSASKPDDQRFVPPAESPRILRYDANVVEVAVSLAEAGRVVLRDLAYPGWTVTVDGEPAESQTYEKLFRSVEVPAGAHTIVWKYEPRSLYWGAVVSVFAFVLLAVTAHVRFWHPHLLQRLRGKK
jgi:hypothetical protein